MSTTQDSVMRGGTASKVHGSPGQGPHGPKKHFYKKTNYSKSSKSSQSSGKNQNTTNKNDNNGPLNKEKRIYAQNSEDQINFDHPQSSQTSGKNQNTTNKNDNNPLLNKEAPSLSTDMGGPPNNPFINKNSPSNQTFSFNFSNDIFSHKPSMSYKERQKARSKAYFQKKFKGNDQQRPKNLTQVTESAWQVDMVKKVHVFVDPQGENIEAMGEVKWKNTIEPIANMQCNKKIQKCLDKVPATFHFNDGTTEKHFIKYNKQKVEQPDYFSNLLGCVTNYPGQIEHYDDHVIHEGWAAGTKIQNFYTRNDNQKQSSLKYKKIDLEKDLREAGLINPLRDYERK